MPAGRPPAPPPGPPAKSADETVTERLRVVRWRSERFQELGYDESHADMLAHCDVEWHKVARMVAGGCPLKLAEKIVM